MIEIRPVEDDEGAPLTPEQQLWKRAGELDKIVGKMREEANKTIHSAFDVKKAKQDPILEQVAALGKEKDEKLKQLKQEHHRRLQEISDEHERAIRSAKGKMKSLVDIHRVNNSEAKDVILADHTTATAPMEQAWKEAESDFHKTRIGALDGYNKGLVPLNQEMAELRGKLKAIKAGNPVEFATPDEMPAPPPPSPLAEAQS